MSISWNHGRVLADTRFVAVHGAPAADGFHIKISIEFRGLAWHDASPAPIVRLAPAQVTLMGEHEIVLGYATPESTIPICLSQHGDTRNHLHELTLSAAAMERVEALRAGQGIVLRLKIQGEIWKDSQAVCLQDLVECRINQSEWLVALDQCGYGKFLLFEVPVFSSRDPRAPTPARYLQQAKDHFVKGHFDEVVAVCRKALESAVEVTQTQEAQQRAVKAFKGGKDKELDFDQRELLIRQMVMNLTHLAHHHELGSDTVRFDRGAASMVLGITASIVSRITSSVPDLPHHKLI
jgi:hypothetical protein